MSAPIRSDPYREPAPEAEELVPRHRRLAAVARRLGMWRWRWVRRALGGRWEKFLIVKWFSNDDDDRSWLLELDQRGKVRTVVGRDRRGLPTSSTFYAPEQMVIGSWYRVDQWSITSEDRWLTVRISLNGRHLAFGAMRFIEFLGSRLAIVAYHREDW